MVVLRDFLLFDEVASYYERLEGISSRLEMIDLFSELLGKSGKEEIKQLVYITQGRLGPAFEPVETGIAEKFAIAAVAMATGHDEAEVTRRYRKSGDMGLAAQELVGSTKLRRMADKKESITEVYEMMRKIAETSGKGSQETKIKLFASLIASSGPTGAKYVTRLALGQLRLGLGDATILEALSKMATGERKMKQQLESAYNICSDLGKVADVLSRHGMRGIEKMGVELFSPIRPALAERLPTASDILERMGGRCAVESKYDGMRAQVHFSRKSKKVKIFSRNLEVVTEMFPEIAAAALDEIDAGEAIFEGEAISYDEVSGEFHPFQETATRKRKHGIDEKSKEMPLHLFAFDLLYYEGESYLSKNYEERRRKLNSIMKKNGLIRPSDMIVTTSPKELEKYFTEAISEGLEGIVAKDLNAPYIAGARKFSWIKMKRSYKSELSDSIDLVIVGYYLGRGQRAEFGFGGLLAAAYNEKRDMFETITRIGTGFTEEQMKTFKRLLDKIKTGKKPARVDSLVEPNFWVEPKYVVTVNADEITRSPMHTCGRTKNEDGEEIGYALRFPRIISEGVREDKSAEDATTTKEIIEMFKLQKKTKLSD